MDNSNNKYFIRITDSSKEASPEPKLPITQEDLHTFPDINKFVDELIKALQEKERIITFKSAEIESLKTLLTHYRNDSNPLETSVKIKEITRNFETEKKNIQDNHLKVLEEKSIEINNLKKEIEILTQDKKNLSRINDNLQQEFVKLQSDLSNTGEKLKALQAETDNMQALLRESEAENQITKAKLIEYEQIGVRTSEKIHEVQIMTDQIRKDSHDILELNRKSLKGMEDSIMNPPNHRDESFLNHSLQKEESFFHQPHNFEEMKLDEELRRLEKIARKLESFSSGTIQTKEKVTAKTHRKGESPPQRAKTKDDLELPKGQNLQSHKKMMSFEFKNTLEGEINIAEIQQISIHKTSGLDTIIDEGESDTLKKKSKSIYKKSKSFVKSGDSEKKIERKVMFRAKSFDSQSTFEEKNEKEEGFMKEMKCKMMDLIENCLKICEKQGVYSDDHEKSSFYYRNYDKGFDDIGNSIRNFKDLFLKYCENLDRFYHQKILKTLELTNNLSQISDKLKGFLQEKQTFERNLNEILNAIEGKDPKSPNEDSNNNNENSNYEGYLMRLRKLIEGTIDDQQSLKSQSLEINDIVNEKNRIENANEKLKKENQTLNQNLEVLQKKIEGIIAKEKKILRREEVKNSEIKENNMNGENKNEELSIEGLDEVIFEIEQGNQKVLKTSPEEKFFVEISEKKESLQDLIGTFGKAREKLQNIFIQLKDFY